MQRGLSAGRAVTGYNSSASLYGGDITIDKELDAYFMKGSKKKKGQQQQQQQQNGNGGGQNQQQHSHASKKKGTKATPAGFVNLGYGLVDESKELVFSQRRVEGTCTTLEKDYLRLTSQADPARVRDPLTLAKALSMVKRKWIDTRDYEYACNQLKSIRQDCTVQHLRNALAVEVYETHARIALEVSDFQEFAVIQTQLQLLYREGLQKDAERENEFAGYKVLYSCLMTGPSDSGLVAFINSLRPEQLSSGPVSHALAVRSSLLTTNYAGFFRLWSSAPFMSAYLMDPLADRMRIRSTRILISAYRPTLSLLFLTHALAFDKPEDGDEDETMAAADAAATAADAERPPPTGAQQRACKEYLEATFGADLVWVREGGSADGSTKPRWAVDCKASHDRLAPTNAAHRLPINSVRAPHTVSSSAAAASPSVAPLAAPHDVANWVKRDLTGRVRLGAIDGSSSSMRPLSGGSTGQPAAASAAAPRKTPLFTPSPSPSPPPPSVPAAVPLVDDAVSRKRKNTQPLSSLSYAELQAQVEQAEAQLLAPDLKQLYDDFAISLMMSRLKALQKAFKKMKKPK